MQTQNQGPGNQLATQQKAPHPLELTKQLINSAPTVSDMLELPAIQNNWVKSYERTTGRHDGTLRFEAEKILFMQAVAGNNQLANCERYTLYGAFTELAISGQTLRDGLAYIVPYGKKASFMVGWKGRLEQIAEMPDVIAVNQPQVVYAADQFDYELGMKPWIHTHKPATTGEKGDITFVYCVIEFTHGLKVFIMDRAKVISIRDNHSTSYKTYIQKEREGKLEPWMDKPMWLTSEDQAFKKTLVRNIYNSLPNKLPKHKWLDQRMSIATAQLGDDPEEVLQQQHDQQQQQQADQNFDSYLEVHDDGTVQQNENEFAGAQQNSNPPPPPSAAAPVVVPPVAPPVTPPAAAAPVKAAPRTTKTTGAKAPAATAVQTGAQQQPQQPQQPETDLYKLAHGSKETVQQLIGKATDLTQLASLYHANSANIEGDSETKNMLVNKKNQLSTPPPPPAPAEDETF